MRQMFLFIGLMLIAASLLAAEPDLSIGAPGFKLNGFVVGQESRLESSPPDCDIKNSKGCWSCNGPICLHRQSYDCSIPWTGSDFKYTAVGFCGQDHSGRIQYVKFGGFYYYNRPGQLSPNLLSGQIKTLFDNFIALHQELGFRVVDQIAIREEHRIDALLANDQDVRLMISVVQEISSQDPAEHGISISLMSKTSCP